MSESNHLDHQELARAAVEASALPRARREHLDACPHCRERVRALLAELEQLGDLARELAPAPPRRFRLPEGERSRGTPWLWRGALAGGLAAAAVLLASLWLGGPGVAPRPTGLARTQAPVLDSIQAPQDLEQTFVSIMDVDEEDPFSPFQRFVLGGEDSSREEQFMNFVSPFDQEDYSRLEKGRARC